MRYALLSLVVFFFAVPALAQVDLAGQLFTIEMSPRYPQPNQVVQLTLHSSVYDISGKNITWRGNGEIIAQGEDQVTAQITAAQAGKATTVSVSVEGTDQDSTITIAPASVDLMWESDTYAPGLYRGRRLPSVGANVTLQALPRLIRTTGEQVPESQITFTWKRGGQVLGSVSGRGKSSLHLPISMFDDAETITVTAVSADRTIGAEGRTLVPATSPVVRLYFDHPLFGKMYHNAVGIETYVPDTEMSFAAVPYFVRATSPNDRVLRYEWRVNRSAVAPSEERPSVITINAGSTGGRARIELATSHRTNLLFDDSSVWDVVFGAGREGSTEQDPFARPQ